jgi:ribosomal subunit interface protein
MSTEITARNFDLTPDIRQLLETKLGKIEDRLFDDVIETRVVLDVQKYRFICEIMMVGKDHDVKVVQESDQSMQDAVNAAIDHARRQASKNRDRITDHRRNEAGPEPLDSTGR